MMTKGEARIVDALFRTGSVRRAADMLGLSRWSIKLALAIVYEKAGVRGATDLVRLAWQNGGFLY